MVGKILKELYVDSATKHLDKVDKEREAESVTPSTGISVSWRDFKKMK